MKYRIFVILLVTILITTGCVSGKNPHVTPTPTPIPTPIPEQPLNLTAFGIKADGSNETTLLQQAFNFATAQRDPSIIFPEGGTIGINAMVETPDNVELIGNNCTIKLLDHSGKPYQDPVMKVHVGNYVHNLKFDGNAINQSKNFPGRDNKRCKSPWQHGFQK